VYSQSTIPYIWPRILHLCLTLKWIMPLTALKEPLQPVSLCALVINLADDFSAPRVLRIPSFFDRTSRSPEIEAPSGGGTTSQPAGAGMQTSTDRIETVAIFVSRVFSEDLHAKRVLSLADGALGVVTGAFAAVAMIGHALAQAAGWSTKHAIKQVDRLLSNQGVRVWDLFALGSATPSASAK